MKRLLCLAVAAASASATVSAEDRTMEHIIVSVPIHRQEADTALPVTILTGDALRRQAAATIGETLANRAGIANATYGPGVGRPVIRGQQGPRAITLQNSTLSADVSGLSPDHSVTVEALLAESIEVLRGPSTLLYGGGAIGGVVNVIDNRIPRKPLNGVEGALEYRYDDASDMDSRVGRLEGGNGSFAFHVSGTARSTDDLKIPGSAIDENALEAEEALLGGHEEEDHEEEELENSEGFIANTDSETNVRTGGMSFHFEKGSYAGISVSHIESEYGLPPGTHEHGHEEEHEGEHADEEHGDEEEEVIRIDMEQTRYDAVVHLKQPMTGIEAVRGFLTYTDYEHDELEGAEVGTRFARETWETRAEIIHDAFFGSEGVIGLQLRMDEFEAAGDEAYVPRTDSTEVGLFLLEDFHVGELVYEMGLRVDHVERDPDSENVSETEFTSISASGSALWQFNKNWQAGLSASRSARAPAAEELFSNVDAIDAESLVTHAATGIIEVGDPDLDEEVSLNIDLAVQWHSDSSWAEMSLFYNSFKDYIFLLNSTEEVDETFIYLYEQEDAEFYGIEFESSFHLANLGQGSVALGVHGDMIFGEFDKSGDIPRLPPARIGGKLSWTSDTFSTWVSVINASDQDDSGNFETETDGYTRWDIGADYQLQFADNNQLIVFLKWKNIGDEEIRLSTSFLRNYAPEAGESIEAGVRFMF
ncbi:MAG: iron complex outermembrane receptor protein [Halieaceae bacterium]|jgi:iron complex outermembrane receptor protein